MRGTPERAVFRVFFMLFTAYIIHYLFYIFFQKKPGTDHMKSVPDFSV